jgi:6-phosphogluconate dehydrogenase
VFARAVSSKPEQRAAVRATVQERPAVQHPGPGFEDDVRAALYASKVVAYAQGFDAIVAGAKEYGWEINLGNIARIWRAGCIIRARFLNRIVDAYANNPRLATLLEDPYFAAAVRDGEAAWRRVVSVAALSGIPAPGFSSALAYYDALASERLPAALIQGQRDFFGAHTYHRVDKEGVFHTLWSGDRSEIETEPSTH